MSTLSDFFVVLFNSYFFTRARLDTYDAELVQTVGIMHEFFRDRMRHFYFGAAGHTFARLKNAQIFASSAVFTRRSVTTTGTFAITAIERARTKAATLASTVTHDFTHFTIKKDTNLVKYKRASRTLRHKLNL